MQSKQLKRYKNHIWLFFNLFLTTVNTCSMDLFLMPKKPIKKDLANVFIKEFPIMTFKNAHQRYKKCFLWTRAKIRNHFAATNDELLLTTFQFATEFPTEIHNQIAFHIFDSNEALSKKFLSSPIKDSYLLYAWAKNVFGGQGSIASSFRIESLNLVLQLSDEVKRAVEIIKNQQKNPSFCVGIKDIVILDTIAQNSAIQYETLKANHLNIRYHKKYTLDAFRDSIFISAAITLLLYMPLTLIFTSKEIDLHLCKKTIIDPLLESKTQELTKLIQKNGKLYLLDAIRNPQDNLAYPLFEQLKKNALFLCIVPIVPILDHLLSPSYARSTFSASMVSIGAAAILWTLSHLPFEKFPGGFLGIYMAIPAILFSLIPPFIYKAETCWYTRKIDWSSIHQKLASDYFFIPEESW